jgi:hypothetical protein
LDKKRRARLMETLERYNNDLQNLLGNSDRLEPSRRKRTAAVPLLFEHFRQQASSLHSAICRSLRCDCTEMHFSKLFLPDSDTSTSRGNKATELSKLKVYFPRRLKSWSSSHSVVGPEDDWYAADVETINVEDDSLLSPRSSIGGPTLSRSASTEALPNTRKVSFQQDNTRRLSSTSTLPTDAVEIQDLCAALKGYDPSKVHLGFLRGESNDFHTLYHAQESVDTGTQWRDSVTLADAISQDTSLTTHESPGRPLRRQQRLEIALAMAKVVLKLYLCPWLKEDWTKDDIYFFRDKQGQIDLSSLSLATEFYPSALPSASPALVPTLSNPDRKRTKSSLLSLGILILEMWFNTSLEACSFYAEYLGPDGSGNEFTRFNVAQKWQEQALEEGGSDLDNLTYRCIHSNFGTAKQDLNYDELRKAVFTEVVEPLKEIILRFG